MNQTQTIIKPGMTYPLKLESERLYTRALKPSDIDIWNTFVQNETATTFFPESMRQPNTAKVWIEKQLERYKKQEFGLLALINRQTNEFTGQCGLLLQELDHGPEVEIGYHVLPEYWGHGFAKEAAQMFRQYAYEQLGLTRIVSIIHPENLASQKVAQANGMLKERTVLYRDTPADLWVWHQNAE